MPDTLLPARTPAAAWKLKPSWYAVSKQDRTTSPDLQRFLANRMHAKTIEVDASHLSLITHPQEITDLILNAAGRRRSHLERRRPSRLRHSSSKGTALPQSQSSQ